MAGNIKGITIEFRGDTTQLDKALRQIDKETGDIDKEMGKVNKGLKFNPTSVDLWRQKQTLLKDKIGETSERLSTLKDAQKKMDADGVDKNSKEYRELQREIITTESKLKNFKNQLKQVGNVKLRALSEKFKQVGSKMTAVGKGLSTYVTAPLVGIGAASVKVGMDFDTAMSQVAATSGKTVDEIGELRDFAKEMGSTTAFSATQAAEGLNYMALAGYDAETSMKMLPTVLDLAAAGAMELGAASDMVTDAQTALGLSCEETTLLVDQMAQTSSKSNTSVEQMGEAILKIGGNAKNLSGGTRELSQVLGLLADNGIKGSEAGTHLRNIMLSLNPTTDKAAQAWEDLGVQAYDADGNLRPLEETFGDLSQALDGMSTEERTKMLSAMFNKTDLASVNALLDTSADRWKELGLAIDDSEGAASKMANTQLDNLQGSLTLLKSALEGAAIAISDVLAPYIRMLADFANNLVTKFNELDSGIQTAIVIIGALAAAIGPILVIIGMISTGLGVVTGALAAVSAPVLAIVAVVGVLIAAFAALMASNEGLRNAVMGLVQEIGAALLPVVKWAVDFFKQLAAEVMELFNEIGKELTPVIIALTPILAKVAKIVGVVLKKYFQLLGVQIKVFLTIVKTLAKVFASVFLKVVSIVKGAVSKIKSAFNGVKNALTHPFETAKNIIKGIIDKIKSFFKFKVSAPHIPLPHFKIKPAGWDIGDLVKGKIPSLSVSWYAKGGIFKDPTVFSGVGIGEAGPEAVIPLDILWSKLDAIAAASGGPVINVYGTAGMNVDQLTAKVEQVLIRNQKQRMKTWGH